MAHDIRMALRSLRRRPAFTATAVLTLALAAGANAAILAVVYGILLKPLPFHEPDRLVAVWPGRFQSNADLEYLREHARMFAQLGSVAPGWTMALTGAGEPRRLTVGRVSGNLFDSLGVRPRLGRAFRESDARKGSDQVVLLTHALWRSHFAGDPAVVGRGIRLEGDLFEVVGVLPADFEVFGLQADAYTPFALDPSAWYHQLAFSLFVARLAPGVTVEQAERDYRALIPRIRQARRYPDDYGRTARLQELRAAVVGDVRPSLLVLGASVALMLLLAAANVGTLLLTWAASRSREFAVRAALGASRARLARELIAEGTIVSISGGVLGTIVACAAMPALVALLPADTPRTGGLGVDWLVAAVVLGAATLSGLFFALAPALAAARVKTASLLRAGAHSESRETKRARGLLVAGEIALALVLAVGAGLMLQTLWRLQRIDPGFAGERVLTMHLQPPDVGFKQRRTTSGFYRELLEQLRRVQGVRAVGAIQHLPFSGYSWNAALDVQGHDVPPGASRPTAGLRIATPGYFKAIGQRVIAGRDLGDADAECENAVVVNQALATKYFGAADAALGRKLRTRGGGIQSAWLSIVGVVGDVRHASLTTAPGAEIYVSISAGSIPSMMVAVRTDVDPLTIVPAVREAVWSVDRNTPISDVETMEAKVGQSLSRPRLLVWLLGGFASVGLLLVVVGVYGIVSHAVTRRRRELGIMVALGAGRSRVMGLVLKDGLRFAGAGLAVGLPAAVLGSRLLRGVVHGISPTDPLTYAALAALVSAVVMLACYVPAVRASRLDPLSALKHE